MSENEDIIDLPFDKIYISAKIKKSFYCFLFSIALFVLNWVFYMFLSGVFPGDSFMYFSYFLDFMILIISLAGVLFFINTFAKPRETKWTKYIAGLINLAVFVVVALIFYARIIDWVHVRI